MKYLKMLGLAAIAALALAAFAGASSASAAVLCKTAPNLETGACGGGKYPPFTKFEATSTNAVFTIDGSSTAQSVSCNHSLMGWENTAETGFPGVPIKISDLTFTGCVTNNGVTCQEVSTTSGYLGEAVSVNTLNLHRGNGTITVHGTGTAATQTLIRCGSIFECKYQPGSAGLSMSLTGGNPYTISVSGAELEKVSGFGFNCGTAATLDASYIGIGSNAALFMGTS